MPNLKRSIIICFSALYLLASTGVLLGQHVCMGRIKETALFKQVEKQCNMSMEMHKEMKDCCDDEWELKKIEDNQQQTISKNLSAVDYHLLYQVPFQDLTVHFFIQDQEIEIKNTGPPDIGSPGLYIRYHSLKIPSLQS